MYTHLPYSLLNTDSTVLRKESLSPISALHAPWGAEGVFRKPADMNQDKFVTLYNCSTKYSVI